MTTMTQSGSTVEAAIEAALQKLALSRDQVEIEVLSQGRKGFFGIGSKEAEVKITVIPVIEPARPEIEEMAVEETPEIVEEVFEVVQEIQEPAERLTEVVEEAVQYLEGIAVNMKIHDLEITYEIAGKYINFQLESKKAALLIGKRGQTLNALQQLVQLVVNKHASQFKVIRIDVGDYRERRQQSLEQLANRMADKAVRTNRKVKLEPMPAYERKVIHHTLSSRLDIETYSEGSDPYRYLVIEAIR